jgi:hypothetical protein
MKFFVLETTIGEHNAETDFYNAVKAERGDAPRCSECNQVIGMLTWRPPFKVEIDFFEHDYADLAMFSDYLMLSEKFVEGFAKENMIGLEILGIAEVVKVKPRKMLQGLPQYYIGGVIRSNVIFDDVASGAKWEKPWTCETCRQGDDIERIKRVVIMDNTWNGEDIFYARGLPGTIITSERFKDFVDRNGFKNIKLIEGSKYSFDFYPNMP